MSGNTRLSRIGMLTFKVLVGAKTTTTTYVRTAASAAMEATLTPAGNLVSSRKKRKKKETEPVQLDQVGPAEGP